MIAEQTEMFPHAYLDTVNDNIEQLQKDIDKRSAAVEGAQAALDLRRSLLARTLQLRDFISAHVPAEVNTGEEQPECEDQHAEAEEEPWEYEETEPATEETAA